MVEYPLIAEMRRLYETKNTHIAIIETYLPFISLNEDQPLGFDQNLAVTTILYSSILILYCQRV